MQANPMAKPRQTDEDNFVTASEFGKYEIAFVFPTDPKRNNNFTLDALDIVQKLTDNLGQKNVLMYRSADQDEIYVLVRAQMDKLKKYADDINYKMLCDEGELEKKAKTGYPDKNIKPIELDTILTQPTLSEITPYRPYELIYAKYEPELDEMYDRAPGSTSPFNARIRIELLRSYIEATEGQGGLGISFRQLQKIPKNKDEKPILLACFALHDKDELDALTTNWFAFRNILPWNQPFDQIKDYFGAKVALYYKFLGHMSWWLLFPAMFGLLCQLVVIGTENIASPIIPFFSLFIVLWGVVMLEYWKREETLCSLKWGTVGFEASEPNRSEFEYDLEVNLKGTKEFYFSNHKRRQLVCSSFSLIALLCACVIGTTAAVYVIRYVLFSTSVKVYSSTIASILNTLQISFYGFVYGKFSIYMTDRENHQTDTSYEDSMIAKDFVFIFINSFASFFFLAFFASSLPNPQDDDINTGQCGAPTCMTALAINLGIILGTRLTVNNAIEWLTPCIKTFFRKRSEIAESGGRMLSRAEEEFVREKYDVASLIADYLEVAIQFAFMTLFVSALPASVFMTLLANWVEIRGDAWSLIKFKQRPFPTGAEDIGTWQSIFDIIISSAIVTNSALIVFTMRLLNEYTLQQQFWIFIGFQWVLFSVMYAFSVFIPDMPHSVEVQLERSAYLESKLICMTPDEEDGGDVALGNRASFAIEGSIMSEFPPSLRAD